MSVRAVPARCAQVLRSDAARSGSWFARAKERPVKASPSPVSLRGHKIRGEWSVESGEKEHCRDIRFAHERTHPVGRSMPPPLSQRGFQIKSRRAAVFFSENVGQRTSLTLLRTKNKVFSSNEEPIFSLFRRTGFLLFTVFFADRKRVGSRGGAVRVQTL